MSLVTVIFYDIDENIRITYMKLCMSKGKAPFHEITSLYSYLEEIWIFVPIQ